MIIRHFGNFYNVKGLDVSFLCSDNDTMSMYGVWIEKDKEKFFDVILQITYPLPNEGVGKTPVYLRLENQYKTKEEAEEMKKKIADCFMNSIAELKPMFHFTYFNKDYNARKV